MASPKKKSNSKSKPKAKSNTTVEVGLLNETTLRDLADRIATQANRSKIETYHVAAVMLCKATEAVTALRATRSNPTVDPLVAKVQDDMFGGLEAQLVAGLTQVVQTAVKLLDAPTAVPASE